MPKIHGRHALITGSATRIGREIALALGRIGWSISVHYHTNEVGAKEVVRELENLGVQAHAVRADLSKIEEVFNLARAVLEFSPTLNLLINSAGHYPDRDLVRATHNLENEDVTEWDYTMNLNLRGPFFLIQQLASTLRNSKDSFVINLLDESISMPFRSRAAYTISKGALVPLTKLAAATFEPEVRVYGIELGPIIPPAELSAEDRSRFQWIGVEPVIGEVFKILEGRYPTGTIVRCVDRD